MHVIKYIISLFNSRSIIKINFIRFQEIFIAIGFPGRGAQGSETVSRSLSEVEVVLKLL